MEMVRVTINGQTIEIAPEVWDVLMRAFNQYVDTGDVSGIDRATLARAKMASGALYLIAHRLPAH